MRGYLRYLLECAEFGWEHGEGIYRFIESGSLIVGVVAVMSRSITEHKWKPIEKWIAKWAAIAFVCSIAVATFIAAPYAIHREDEEKIESLNQKLTAAQKPIKPTPIRDDAMRLVAALDALCKEYETNKLSRQQCVDKFMQRDYAGWIVSVHGKLFTHNRSSDKLDVVSIQCDQGSGFMMFQNTASAPEEIIKGIREEVYRLASTLTE